LRESAELDEREKIDDVVDVLRECEETSSGSRVGELFDVGMFGHVDERKIMGEWTPTSMGSARRRRRSSRLWSARAMARGCGDDSSK